MRGMRKRNLGNVSSVSEEPIIMISYYLYPCAACNAKTNLNVSINNVSWMIILISWNGYWKLWVLVNQHQAVETRYFIRYCWEKLLKLKNWPRNKSEPSWKLLSIILVYKLLESLVSNHNWPMLSQEVRLLKIVLC